MLMLKNWIEFELSHLNTNENIILGVTPDRKRLVFSWNNPVEIKNSDKFSILNKKLFFSKKNISSEFSPAWLNKIYGLTPRQRQV